MNSTLFSHREASQDPSPLVEDYGPIRVPHPFPYQGSKRKIARFILPWIQTDSLRLVEPFCGSAAVSLALASVKPSTGIYLNDTNMPLMSLWHQILDAPQQLADQYSALWHKQEDTYSTYLEVRAEFNKHPRPDLLLFLLAKCVKASVRYNSRGEFNQSPDKRRWGMRPDTMTQHILRTSRLLDGRVTFSCQDAFTLVDSLRSKDIVYLDPPYQGTSESADGRYISGMSRDTLIEFLSLLNDRSIDFILSYDGNTGTKRYGDWLPNHLDLRRLTIPAGKSTQSTLLGTSHDTFESLYLSKGLGAR